MTRVRVDGVPHIEAESPQRCEMCGKVAETRPYGPKGEEVCFPCGMMDEAAMKRAFGRFLNGERAGPPPIPHAPACPGAVGRACMPACPRAKGAT